MAHQEWTKPQSDAIFARGGSALVSAAAGSGKTAVLVERAITLICDEKNPIDADRLLIVTFSNAAAAEMKQRMASRLSAMVRENPSDLFLQRQQALLGAAQISTIHSFCLELLRSNFQNLDISPDFSVADENELAILKSDCAAACIEEFYKNDEDGVFSSLVELLSSGRDDSRLIETILKIYDFSRAHPFFEDWLDEKLTMYDDALPPEKTVWGQSILRHAVSSLEFCHASALSAIGIISCDDKMEKAYGSAFNADIYHMADCLNLARSGEWDKLAELLRGFEFARLGPLRGDDPLKEQVKDARGRYKDIIGGLSKKYLNATGADFKLDIADLQPKIQILFAIVKRFSREFSEAKALKHRLDFSDFEHLTLKLLVEKTKDGYVRTKQAHEIADRFDHILVDEYQDTNEVQDLIFTSVSREQENLFMVGDVKQSIYAFRQAMPEIFMAKKRSFFPYETGFFPAKINLDTNFRSRKEVISAVNYLFGRLMSPELGDVDYNDEESLKTGASYPDYDGAKPMLMLVSAEKYEGEKDATALEAAEIARRIAEMLDEGYMVSSGGELRAAMPRDFCVLLRAPKNRAGVYVRELTARGVPAWAESSGGYLAAREVSSVICLLKALDNPLLDVELVAAMLSPLFDFDDGDIAEIRLKARGVPFYTALNAASETDEKAAGFLKIFSTLRSLAAILPADGLIMKVYEMTGAIPIMRAMPMGETRAANLQLLIEYAAEYHKLGYKQLGGFIDFITRLEAKNRDLAPANTMGSGANVVRIMSIHHSKGLEFPVVFLADAAKSFNKTDLRSPTMLHSKFGFACVRRDNKVFKQFPTIPMQAIKLESERSILSEEMRILYVALTRAREKLIITALCKQSLQKKLNGIKSALENLKLAPYAVSEGGSYADWVLMALLHHKSAVSLREIAGMDDIDTVDDQNPWEIIICEPTTDERESMTVETSMEALPDKAVESELNRRTSYVYPYLTHTKIPSKLAVSDVVKRESAISYRFSQRPKFMSEHDLTAAEKGNAMHKFMQFASYENARDNLDAEIARMRSEKFLSDMETESLSKQKLRSFFRSKLAKRIFASEKVYRELKFMSECGGEILGGMFEKLDADGGKIVLQGVADCVFIENGCAIIVDYKTDRVTEASELIGRYGVQLSLYKAILSESLDISVSECVIYSFSLSSEIKL